MAQPQSGADILVQCLVNHGVDVVFAYPGGASMPIHQALTRFQQRLRTILPRHEQGGGFAAEGYARSTGKPGVCIATSGPGATNFVTCLADAKMDSVPLIAITGQVGTHIIGTDAFQETPMVEVCRAITKHAYLVTRTEDLPRVFQEAFHIASTGRPGPVLVDVPKDVQQRQVAVTNWSPPMNLAGYRPYRRAARPELEKVLELVRASRKPLEALRSGRQSLNLSPEGVAAVLAGYDRDGYGYADYPATHGYGISVTSPEWVRAHAPEAGIWGEVYHADHAWDNNQDVYGLVRVG